MESSNLKKEMLTNFIGRNSEVLIVFLATPCYIHLLGVESFGLVSFTIIISNVFSFLETSLTSTLSYLFSSHSENKNKPSNSLSLYNIFQVIEFVYILIAIISIISIFFSAPYIATNWLNIEKINVDDAILCIRIFGFTLACRFPLNGYSGALMGLNQVKKLNILNVSLAIAKHCIGVLLLFYVTTPTMLIYFSWQLAINALGTLILRQSVLLFLHRNSFHWTYLQKNAHLLKSIFTYSFKISLLSITTIVIMQLDKIVLSKYANLSVISYYNISFNLAWTLGFLSTPLNAVAFAKFSSILSSEEKNQHLPKAYCQSQALLSCALIPPALLLVFFPETIILLWTQNQSIATHSALPLQFLVIGALLSSFSGIAAQLQLASKWFLSLKIRIVVIPFYIILLLILIPKYGILGAAVTSSIAYGMDIFGFLLMHKKLLKNYFLFLLKNIILKPLLLALLASLLIKSIFNMYISPYASQAWVGILFLGTTLATTTLFVFLVMRERLKTNS